jgi:hypothetical protein
VLKSLYLEDYLETLLKSSGQAMVKARENVFFIIPEKLRWDYGKNGQSYLVFNRTADKSQLIKGRVIDSNSGEAVVGAQVVIPETGAGILTNIKGIFN